MENENKVVGKNGDVKTIIHHNTEPIANTISTTITSEALAETKNYEESSSNDIPIATEPKETVVNTAKKKSKLIMIIVSAFILFATFIAIYFLTCSSWAKYNKAIDLEKQSKYDEAISIYQELGNYKDSKDKIELCNFEKALSLINKGKYFDAKNILINLDTNEEIEENLKLCNHMILYDYVIKNGIAHKDVYYIDNPETGVSIQVKNDDKTIRFLYEYNVDETAMMTTVSAFSPESNNVDIAYFLEVGEGYNYQGDGIFYPHLYDGNLDNTTGDPPENKMALVSDSPESKLWIDDINYSPYINIDVYNSGIDAMDELAALQYYIDFSSLLETLSNHIDYIDCGVNISDLGIVLV